MDLNQLRLAGIDPNLIRLLAEREADQVVSTPVVEAPPGEIQSLKEIPAFTPEEEEGLVASVGRKALSGLQWLGESVDKPRRAVAGLVGGQPREILSLIPFSDTLGITNPEQIVTGRDLLEKVGLPENKPGLDVGDVAGFALEVATDPMNLLTLGGGTVASKVLGEGAAASKALTAATKADEIAAGVRPLVSVHTPSFGIPLPSKIPFTDIKIPRAALPVKELAQFGTGEKAANVYRALHYGKYSPNPYIRKIFSASPEVRKAPIHLQEAADRSYEYRTFADDLVKENASNLYKMEEEASREVSDLLDRSYFGAAPTTPRAPTLAEELVSELDAKMSGGASAPAMMTNKMRSALAESGYDADAIKNMTPSQAWDAIRSSAAKASPRGSAANSRVGLMVDAIEQLVPQSAELQSLVRAKFGDNVDWAKIKADKKSLAEVEKLYGGIQRNQQEYLELAGDLREKHDTLLSMIVDAKKSTDPLHATWFDDTIRAFVERKDGLGLTDVSDALRDAGLDGPGLDKAAGAVYALSDELRNLDKAMHSELRRLGIDVGTLDDYYVGHSFRRPSMPEGSVVADFFRAREIPSKAPFMTPRGPVMSDIPGGTRTANEISRNPLFTSVKHNKEEADRRWAEITDVHAPDMTQAPQPGTWDEPVWEIAQEQGIPFSTLRGFAKGVVDEAAQTSAEMIAQKKTIHGLASDVLGSDWRKTVNRIVQSDSDYTTLKGFDEVAQMVADRYPGISSDMLWEMMKNHGKSAKVSKAPADIAAEALARYRSAESANAKAFADGDEFSFDPDAFDVTKDPTMFPDPAFGGKKLQWSANNAAFLMAKQYNLPAWWDHDKIIRSAIAEGAIADDALIALAKDESIGHTTFKDKWWEMAKAKESVLPPEAEHWATNSVDVEDFTINAKAMIPELARIPIKSQQDLLDLATKMYHMPKAVLEQGLFNRGTVTDTVDYLIQATRLKAGVSSLRSILKSKGVLSTTEEAGSVKLADAWKGAGLTSEGVIDFAKEFFSDASMPLEDLAKKLDSLYVTPEIAKMMTGFVKVFKAPEEINDFMQWVDAANSLFKGTLTIPYMAFHTRNRVSGLVANWIDGIYSSDAEREAHELFHGMSKAPDAEDLLREIKVQGISAVGRGGASGQVNDIYDQFGGIGENAMPLSTSKSGAVNTFRYITNPFGELVADTREAYHAGGVKGAAKQLFMGGKRADGSTATDLNPTGISGALDPLGVGSRKGRLDKYGRPVSGAEKWTAPETTNAIYKAGSNANTYVEWMNRVGPYIALRRAGWSPAMAARKVRQVQFDYRELSEFERRVFKRVMPFYSYMRKNLERQASLLLENPGGRTAQAIRLENKAAREGKGEEGYVPKYLAESFAVRLPGESAGGQQKFFSQSGLLPFEEAFNRFAFDDGLNPLNMRRTGEKFLAQAHPLIQAPLEHISGKQFWSGRSLDDLYQSPTGDQDINLMLSKLPTSRLYNTVGGLFDGRKNLAEKAFNVAMGGAKITDVDVVKQRALETRDILEQSLASDPDIAKYTGLYANDLKSLIERYNNGDQEAAKMLKLYQDIAAELRAMKKAKEAETAAKQ